MFELTLVSKTYRGRPVLHDLLLTLAPGERLALLGPSGVGKSTLLNIIAGLDSDFTGQRRADPGLRIGYLFQEPRLLPWRSVQHNLALVDASPARIARLLEEVGLPDVGALYPHQLSLGMARRVALARALAFEPDLLLLDEPLASLDADTAKAMRQLLQEVLQRRPDMSLVLVSHDPQDAAALTTRRLVLGSVNAEAVASVEPREPGITTK